MDIKSFWVRDCSILISGNPRESRDFVEHVEVVVSVVSRVSLVYDGTCPVSRRRNPTWVKIPHPAPVSKCTIFDAFDIDWEVV